MKKAGKVKKFSDGGLMRAMSEMQNGPSRSEMAKMSIADQVAKMPKNSEAALVDAISSQKPTSKNNDVEQFVKRPQPTTSDDAEITLSKKPQPVEKKGSSSASDEIKQALMSGKNAEAAMESFSRNKPNQMKDIFGTSLKKGGKVQGKSSASSASNRGDGIAQRGKTKGRMI